MKKELIVLVGFLALISIAVLFYFVMTLPPPPSPRLVQCYSQIEGKLEEMKTKIEAAVIQKTQQTIDFEFRGCYEPSREEISIERVTKAEVCNSYCGTPRDACDLLTYQHTGGNVFSIRKCLGISADTVFTSNANEKCTESDKMLLIDLRKEIKQGTYLLINATEGADTYPTICAYLKDKN